MLNQSLLHEGTVSASTEESLLTIVAIDTTISVLVVLSMAMCAWFIWYRHSLQREERDKLGKILQEVYWDHEQEILQLLDVLNNLRHAILFREVTQLHVLAYKYRTKHQMILQNGDYCTFSLITKVQHFFERIRLELPLKGKCPKSVSDCVKSTMFKLAMGCLEFWTDSQVHVLQGVMKYFCGALVAEMSSKWICDEELSTLIISRTPYVDQLQYSSNHFILGELKYEPGMKIDFCSKVRYIDIILARSDPSLQNKQKFLLSIYNTAREICVKNDFVAQKNLLPDIPPAGQTDPVSIHDVVMYIRHLIRTLCMEKHLPVIQSDDKFCKVLLSLYEQLYGINDPAAHQEVIERIKKNIISSLEAIKPERMGNDIENVRFKLEEMERGLTRQLSIVGMYQENTKKRRRDLLAAHQHTSAKSFESETSVYTMALSASAFGLQRQGTYESDLANTHRFLSPQHSAEGLSAPNGLYDTASSLPSTAVNENTPLISNTPPTPLSSSSPDVLTDRPQSPLSIESDYYETAV